MAKFNPEFKVWASKIVKSSYKPDTYLGVEILKYLKETPDRVLQIFHDDDSEVTCDMLRIQSVRIAQNLLKFGLEPDDVVGVICKNSNEVTFLLNACVLIGCPINPLNMSFSKEDMKHLFSQTTPKLVVCDREVAEKTHQVIQELKLEAKIFVTDRGPLNYAFNLIRLMKPTNDEDDFIPPKFTKSSREKLLAILCSSGTTGLPKGVEITHSFVLEWRGYRDTTPMTRSFTFSPIYWGTGFYLHIIKCFGSNNTTILTRQSFSVEALKEIVEKHQITNLTLAQRHLAKVLNSDFAQTCDHESIKSISCIGSTASESLRQNFAETFPRKNLVIFYSLTEASVSMTLSGEYKDGLSVGSFFLPNTIIKVINDEGENLGENEAGEICVMSRQMFQGYYNNPEATENAFDDEGFFKTGDIGYIDEKGALFVIDRKKEVMKCNGYQVTPSEIESVIEDIEGVEVASVVGVPDPEAVELPAAVVLKRKGYDYLSEQEIQDLVSEKFPHYKHLHGGVYFVNELPMTATGKIQKRVVREIVINRRNEKIE